MNYSFTSHLECVAYKTPVSQESISLLTCQLFCCGVCYTIWSYVKWVSKVSAPTQFYLCDGLTVDLDDFKIAHRNDICSSEYKTKCILTAILDSHDNESDRRGLQMWVVFEIWFYVSLYEHHFF